MQQLSFSTLAQYFDDTKLSLVAVQGPGAQTAVQKLVPDGVDLAKVGFMVGFDTTLAGLSGCRITRCGYTGEDGFELSVPSGSAVALAEAILSDTSVHPAGLGARHPGAELRRVPPGGPPAPLERGTLGAHPDGAQGPRAAAQVKCGRPRRRWGGVRVAAPGQ